MWDYEIDVIGAEAGALQHILAGAAHAVDGLLEDLLTLELPLGGTVQAALMRVGAADAVDTQDLAGLAVAAEFLDLQTLVAVGGLQHDGGSAIAEQHGDIAVVPVQEG